MISLKDTYKFDELPFIHYLIQDYQDRSLLTFGDTMTFRPNTGIFAVPLKQKEFHPVYRFHYRIYLGQGNCQEIDGTINLNGVAIHSEKENKLILNFGRILENKNKLFVPAFIPSYNHLPSDWTYTGKFKHGGLEPNVNFMCLEPNNPYILDDILSEFKITMLGCYNDDED